MTTLLTDDVDRAADLLRAGGLVALPTETVYGLGADAANRAAVLRVYEVKGRPADHPLIVHLAQAGHVERWAVDIPDYARSLMQRWWPGPLTLVLPRSPSVGDWVTAGQPTIALRVPSHPVAQQVLQRFGGGVAAPSANRFGRVSPTRAAHVLAELGGRLEPGRDAVLDGGSASIGLESTIVDCTGPTPRVLRPGAISAQEIADATSHLDRDSENEAAQDSDSENETRSGVAAPAAPRVPGTLAAHYAPTALVRVFDSVDELPGSPSSPQVGFLATADVPPPANAVRLATPETVGDYAADLYQALRRADDLHLREVWVLPPSPGADASEDGLLIAIRDRLARAATGSRRVDQP